MPTLVEDLAAEARQLANAARFMPRGRERDRAQRTAELLEHAARRLDARDATAGLEGRSRSRAAA